MDRLLTWHRTNPNCTLSSSKSECPTIAAALSITSTWARSSSSIRYLLGALVATWSAWSFSNRQALRVSSSPSSLSFSSSPSVFACRRRERRDSWGRWWPWRGLGRPLANTCATVRSSYCCFEGGRPFCFKTSCYYAWYRLPLLAKPKPNRLSKYRSYQTGSNASSAERQQACRQCYVSPCVIVICAVHSQSDEEESV